MQDDVIESTNGKHAHVLRRVAITGIGVISPLGSELDKCFEQLAAGSSATDAFNGETSPVRGLPFAAVVRDFDPAAVVGKKNIKRTARFLQMGLSSARMARADAALGDAGYETERVGCLFGSSLGGLEMVNETANGFATSGMRGVSPFLLPGALNNMAAGMIAIDANVHGPCYAVSAGWASSTFAVGQAFEMIRRGAADAMLTGGSESLFESPLATVLLGRSGLFADQADAPTAASKPFDAARRGLVAGEGATMLVLESMDSALARGAKVYAEVIGYASSFAPKATQHRSSWSAMMASCMQYALRSAALDPSEVEYVNAYGSGSQATDAMETTAIKQVFGANAKQLWLSSYKGAAGHMLGASGAFETAMTSLALQRGVIPPTANLRSPDPACDLDFMAGSARERKVQVAMKNTFGESGHCGSLILRVAA
ncbi:MAG: beta-ketoacyl-[acyl-carrier-protein] synthase family protein [Polyangiales bacterium]